MTLRLITSAAICLLAVPAFAQSGTQGTSSSSGTQAQQQQQPGSTAGSQAGSGAAGSQASGSAAGTQARGSAMTQDRLRQQLQQAGFQSVQILDAAYLVQARTSDGNSVFMVVNPPAAGAAQATGSSMPSGSGSSGGSGSGSSGSSGSNP